MSPESREARVEETAASEISGAGSSRGRWARWGTLASFAAFVPVLAGVGCGGSDTPTEPDENEIQFTISSGTGFWFGTNLYVEYRPGTIPVILTAPHGGSLEPASIPNRTYGVTVTDSNTEETTLEAWEAIEERLGGRPHVVMSHLRRTKLDPNREIVEAAQGDPAAELAWREYHALIDTARARVVADHGSGLVLDMHGHGHTVQRLELGYLLNSTDLTASDSVFDARDGAETSLRALGARTDEPFSDILRGEFSFGALLEDRGVAATPSPRWPDPQIDTIPGTEPFFSGGYTTARHGSRDGGTIDAIQIEHNWQGVRQTLQDRRLYADRLAEVLEIWLERYY